MTCSTKIFVLLLLFGLLQGCASNETGDDATEDLPTEVPTDIDENPDDQPDEEPGEESSGDTSNENTPVSIHGQLAIEEGTLVDQHGESVQLEGMSLFWSQWQPQFYNYETVKNLKEYWNVEVVRAAMAIEHDGYLANPEREKEKVARVIDAAIDLGLYVIVDWHDHHAEDHMEEAKQFFSEIAQEYGSHPNLIYEPYNEPLQVSWSDVLKPYHEEILSEIRKYDPDNVVVLGTPEWSQRVDAAAQDPVEDNNVAYTLHFYAGTHKDGLRSRAKTAIEEGLPLFVTEYGTVNADGDGAVAVESTKKWFQFMQEHNLSWVNWSIADKDESSAAILPGTTPGGLKNEENLTVSGKLVRSELLEED